MNTSFASVSFAPNGSRIALATTDRGVIVVDAFKPRKEYALLCAHPCMSAHPCGAAWSPDSRQLAVGAPDGHAWVYDVSDGPGGLPRIPDELLSYDWHPSLVKAPEVVIAGEAHKSAAARAAAFDGARAHRVERHRLMHEKRVEFCKKSGRPLNTIGPPLPPLPYVLPPTAANADEMVSRQNAPLTAIAWHPRAPVLATGAHNVALWGLPNDLPDSVASLVGGIIESEDSDMPLL